MRILPGGSGQQFLTELLLDHGAISIGKSRIELSGARVEMLMDLRLDPGKDAGGARMMLASAAQETNAATVTKLTMPQGKLSPFEAQVVQEFLTSAIAATHTNWSHCLAELVPEFGVGGVLRPNHAKPVYMDAEDGAPARLAIMARFDGKPLPSPALVPAVAQCAGADVVLTATPAAFLEYVLKPALITWLDVDPSRVSVKQDAGISVAEGDAITSCDVPVSGFMSLIDSVTASVVSAEASFDDAAIKIVFAGNSDLKPFDNGFTATARVAADSDPSTGALRFAFDGKVDIDISDGMMFVEAMVGFNANDAVKAISEHMAQMISSALSVNAAAAFSPHAVAASAKWHMPKTPASFAWKLGDIFQISAKIQG